MSPVVMHLWAAAEAFPVVEATNTSVETELVTSHTVSLPSGLANNDLAILFLRFGTDPSTPATPSGWTALLSNDVNGAYRVLYRVCNGAEGGTLAVTTDLTSRSVHTAYRVSGAAVSEAAFIEGNVTLTTSPPSVTASWGSAKNLWLSSLSGRSSLWTAATPANYASTLTAATADSTSSTRARVYSAQRNLETATEQPAEWVVTDGGGFTAARAFTIVVRPA